MDSLAQKWLHMYEFSNLIPKNTYGCSLQNKIADFEIVYFTIPSLQCKLYTNGVTTLLHHRGHSNHMV